mgnify:CR=1 FL=1
MTSFSLRRAVFGAVMLTGVLLLGCGCSRDGACLLYTSDAADE